MNKRIATNPLGIRMPDGHIIFPAVYTRPNQKPISAPSSISRCGARVHPHCYPQLKTTSSPHGQDSPNNLSKIPSKVQSNSKRLHSEILQSKAVNTSQETKRNAEQKSNSHTQCFSSSNRFSGKIYTNQTSRFPVTSRRGFRYIMVA